MRISLIKPVFTLLWLALEFFPARSQGPSLGSPSKGFTRDLGYDYPLVPHFSYNTITSYGTRKLRIRNSLEVRWLGLCAFTTEDMGSKSCKPCVRDKKKKKLRIICFPQLLHTQFLLWGTIGFISKIYLEFVHISLSPLSLTYTKPPLSLV